MNAVNINTVSFRTKNTTLLRAQFSQGRSSLKVAHGCAPTNRRIVDIQPEMLDIIDFIKQENNVTNIETVLASPINTKLPPESIDLALMVDAYHEFEYPREVITSITKALKPGGKVVLVEYRGENPLIMIKRLHKMTQKQVKKEMQAVGLTWRKTEEFLPQQHFMVFEKSAQTVSLN